MELTIWWILDAIVAILMIVMFPAYGFAGIGIGHGKPGDGLRDSQAHIFWDFHAILLLLMLILTPPIQQLAKFFGIFAKPELVGAFLVVYSCFFIEMPWVDWNNDWEFYAHFVSFVALVLGLLQICLAGNLPLKVGK